MSGYEAEVFQVVMRFLGMILGTSVLAIAASVFLGLCVYYDAKARRDSNAALWGVLSGFFNIAALVYIIVKLAVKEKPIYCMRCGRPFPKSLSVCPSCGTPVFGAYAPGMNDPALLEKWKTRRSVFLILFITAYIVSFVLIFVLVFGFIQDVARLAEIMPPSYS